MFGVTTEMLPSLDNFVSFGGETIKARADYRQMLLDIYSTAMTNDQLGENDRVNGSKLAESMLLNLRGSLDDVRSSFLPLHHHSLTQKQALPFIIPIAFRTLESAQSTSLKLVNLEVLINTILYNPTLSLLIIQNTHPNNPRLFFDKWFAAINSEKSDKLPRVHDKKLTIVALCALLEVSPEGIPAGLREGWPGIVGGIIRTFKELPKAVEGAFMPLVGRCKVLNVFYIARKALEQALQEDVESEEEPDDKFLNFADTEGKLSFLFFV